MSKTIGDLLAILLGDGGHYEAEHGRERAIEEAVRRHYERAAQLENAEMVRQIGLEELGDICGALGLGIDSSDRAADAVRGLVSCVAGGRLRRHWRNHGLYQQLSCETAQADAAEGELVTFIGGWTAVAADDIKAGDVIAHYRALPSRNRYARLLERWSDPERYVPLKSQ